MDQFRRGSTGGKNGIRAVAHVLALRRIWTLRLYRLRRNETVDRLGRRALCPLSEQGQEGTATVIFPATRDDMLRGGCVFLKMKECLACRELLHS
jgi:hypothetical protein